MNLFLIILFVIAGYFALFGWIMARSDGRWSVSALLLVTLLVYLPVVCAGIVAAEYLGEAGLMLYGAAAVYCCLYWIWKIYRAIQEPPGWNWKVFSILAAYLAAVFYIAVFMRESGMDDRVQMEVFHWVSAGEEGAFRHVCLNVALFMPIGFLCAVLPKEERAVFVPAVSFGLLLSVLIETIQLFGHFGTCDIDDILSNFLGAVAGALPGVIRNRKRRPGRKPGPGRRE